MYASCAINDKAIICEGNLRIYYIACIFFFNYGILVYIIQCDLHFDESYIVHTQYLLIVISLSTITCIYYSNISSGLPLHVL